MFSLPASASPDKVLTRVSVAENGDEANGTSEVPALSANGRYLAFASSAHNLVVGKTGYENDIFVRDNSNGKVVKLTNDPNDPKSVGSWNQAAISGNGRWVAYVAWSSNNVVWLAVYDRDSDRDGIFDEPGATRAIYPGIHRDGHDISYDPDSAKQAFSNSASISRDGRYGVFSASYLDTDKTHHAGIFLLDLNSGSDQANWIVDGMHPTISADGKFIVFCDHSTNPDPIPLFSKIYELNRDSDGNGVFDETGKTSKVLVSVNSKGESADFDGNTHESPVSDDGRYILFGSQSTNLVENDTNESNDVFLRDTKTNTTTLVSKKADGTGPGNSHSGPAALSADGQWAIFYSSASDLVTGDTNGVIDFFLWNRSTGSLSRIPDSFNGIQGDKRAGYTADFSGNGNQIVFDSMATNLVPKDYNNTTDIFMIGEYVPQKYSYLPMIENH